MIYSGSEDCNVRIWKAQSDVKLGEMSRREDARFKERRALLSKYKFHRQIRNIKRSRVPKYIINHERKSQAQKESRYRKVENMRVNNADIFEEPKPEKVRKIVKKM